MSRATCKGCGAAIKWVGKHPVEPEKLSEWIATDAPISQGRRITLVLPDATVVTGLHGSILTPGARQFEGHVSHFAVCPKAKDFRRSSSHEPTKGEAR